MSKELISTIGKINESRRAWLLRKFEYAANRINKGVHFKVWQDGFHPVQLSTNKMIDDRLNYIYRNPVEEGYVYEPHHYIYNSAKDYSGEKGPLVLQMLD